MEKEYEKFVEKINLMHLTKPALKRIQEYEKIFLCEELKINLELLESFIKRYIISERILKYPERARKRNDRRFLCRLN